MGQKILSIDVKNIYIRILYMSMWTLISKRVIFFSTDPFDCTNLIMHILTVVGFFQSNFFMLPVAARFVVATFIFWRTVPRSSHSRFGEEDFWSLTQFYPLLLPFGTSGGGGQIVYSFRSPCLKGHAYQVWSKLAQCSYFQRRWRKFENVNDDDEKRKTNDADDGWSGIGKAHLS